MITDKNGNEIKVGDEIIVRATVENIISLGDTSLLQVQWQTDAYLIDFVKPAEVERTTDE